MTLRNLSRLALATLVACACTHQTTSRSTAMPADARDANKRSIEKLFSTFNTGDLAPLDELIAPDYDGPQGGKGPASFRAVVVGLRNAFPDIHYTVDELLAEGDRVAVRWHWTGTHKGQFRAFPPTGKEMSNPGLAIFRLENGKVVAAHLETDRLGFLEQIGAVPHNTGAGPRPAAQ